MCELGETKEASGVSISRRLPGKTYQAKTIYQVLNVRDKNYVLCLAASDIAPGISVKGIYEML